MESAIWTTFYDYPDEDRNRYLGWLHDVHVPKLLSRPGYLWVAHYEAVPKGTRLQCIGKNMRRSDDPPIPADRGYAVLIGGESTRTFFDPSPKQIDLGYDLETSEMMARRIRPVSYIHTVEWRTEGPGYRGGDPSGTPAPAIQMGCFDAPGRDEEVAAWYAQERMVLVSRTPGCAGGRKLLAVAGAQRHGVLYDFLSLELREKNFVPLEETDWTAQIHRYLVHPLGSPFVGRRIWPPVKP